MVVSKMSPDKLALAASQNKREREFWLSKLIQGGDLLKSNFPFDYKKGDSNERLMKTLTFQLSEDIFSRLINISKGSDHTLNVVLTAGLVVLLGKYTGSSDIVIGAPIYKQDVEAAFVNTFLVLRHRFEENAAFKQILVLAGQTIVEAIDHYSYPIELLDGFPFCDVVILLENIHDRHYIQNISPNIIFSFTRTGEYIKVVVEYDSLLYAETTIDRIIDHFIHLFQAALFNIDLPLPDIDILSEEEKRQLLTDFNNTAAEYPADQTIHQLFELQAARTPDHIAVIGILNHLTYVTYKQLNRKSNQLAHVLRSKGVGPDTIVPVMGGRTIELIVGIMAVLEAGGAYLPIDLNYPEDRISYILADSNAGVLVSEDHGAAPISEVSRDIEIIDLTQPISLTQPTHLTHLTHPTHLSYVIYTSGSTGRPKGVMMEQRQLVNLVYGLEDRIYKHYGNPLNVALVAPFMFDASVKQIFAALLLGHALHLVPEETRLDGSGLIEFYNNYQIDVSDGTPTHLRLMIECLKGGKVSLDLSHLLIGGEALPQQVVVDFFNLFTTRAPGITNVYGPTECCVDSTSFEITRESRLLSEIVSIGKAMPNTQTYILSNSGGLVPPGVVGELYIAGHGVSRGYLGKAEMTADAFVKNPFTANLDRKSLLYRTGDLCRWLADGNIEFLGRKDHQVKIRGFRVELGEIENQLLKHQEVKEAVVIDRKDAGGDRYLCAYIVPHSNPLPPVEGTFPTAELKEYLSKMLPGYMVPLFYTVLDRIPFTSSGKVDRKALPLPEIEVGEAYAAPRDAVEKTLVELWSELLFIEKDAISIDANFFDLGGHSLRAIILTAKIHKAFDVKIPLVEIFNAPTIRGLSRYINESAKEIYTNIPAVEKKEYYRLSFAQKRMYILQQMDPQSVVYNIPQVIPLEIGIDEEKLENIFQQLINRHESLRTSFIVINEEPVQRIYKNVEFKIKHCSMEHGVWGPEGKDSFVQPFDLSQAPLMRVGFKKTEEEKYILMVDMHHIITDAVSHGILAKEFMALYSGEELSPLRLQYKDYAEWENSEAEREFWQKQEAYWLKEFAGEIPVLHLPTDFERPKVLGFKGSSISFMIDAALTGKIKQCASQMGVTLMMFLLSAYKIMLSKYSGQEELVVGTVIAGRRHADLENVIGFFVNMLAIKTRPAKNQTFPDYLSEVKEKAVNAYENQDYQFEELVNKLEIQRQPGKHPLVDTVFAFHQADQQAPQAEENLVRGAHFDLMLYAIVVSDSINGIFEYSTDLFKKATVEELSHSYIKVLKQAVENPNITLAEIKIDLNLLVSRSTVIQEDDKDWDL